MGYHYNGRLTRISFVLHATYLERGDGWALGDNMIPRGLVLQCRIMFEHAWPGTLQFGAGLLFCKCRFGRVLSRFSERDGVSPRVAYIRWDLGIKSQHSASSSGSFANSTQLRRTIMLSHTEEGLGKAWKSSMTAVASGPIVIDSNDIDSSDMYK